MANSYLSVSSIAQEALPLLLDNMAMLPIVHRGFDGEFSRPYQKGDTIQIEKPQNFSTVDGTADISSSFQDITETAVNLTLNQQRSVPIKITSKDLTLSVKDFTRKFTAGAVGALGTYVNQSLLGLYSDIPYYYGTSGTTISTLNDLASSRKILQDNKAPADMRSFVMDNAAEASLLKLDSLVEVDKSGINSALRDAALGRVYGINMYADSDLKDTNTHTAGTFTAVTTPLTNGSIAAAATTLTLDGGSGTETLLVGDILKIGSQQYTVTANAAAVGGAISVSVYPAVPATIADGTAVVFPDKTAGGHVANLMFQKNAFALGMAPLAKPVGGAESAVVSYKGMSIRVVMDYLPNTDISIMRFDVLYGVKTLYPELAVRVLG